MKLLQKPNQNSQVIHEVTPSSASWDHLSFKVVKLEPGETYSDNSNGCEEMIVFISGHASASAGGQDFVIEGRSSVFEGLPERFRVGRYHSLHARRSTLPKVGESHSAGGLLTIASAY